MNRRRGCIGFDSIGANGTGGCGALVGRIGADEEGIRIVGNKEVGVAESIIMLSYIGHSLGRGCPRYFRLVPRPIIGPRPIIMGLTPMIHHRT